MWWDKVCTITYSNAPLLTLRVASNVMSMRDFLIMLVQCRYEYHYLQELGMIFGYCFTTNLV